MARNTLPSPTQFAETPVDLSVVPNRGNDDSFGAVISDPHDATATPADPMALIVEVSGIPGLEFYPVNRNGDRINVTDCYGDGDELAMDKLYLRWFAASQTEALVSVLSQVGCGLLVITGLFTPKEQAAAFRCSFNFACRSMGIQETHRTIQLSGDQFVAVCRVAAEINSPAGIIGGDKTAPFVASIANQFPRFNVAAPGTKSAGMSIHAMPTSSDGKPLFGFCYDLNWGMFASFDAFEVMTLQDWFIEVSSNPRLATYVVTSGYTLSDGSLGKAFEDARKNRRILFWAAMSVGAVVYGGGSTFIEFGDDEHSSYCRTAMTSGDLKVLMEPVLATMTSEGAWLQFEKGDIKPYKS